MPDPTKFDSIQAAHTSKEAAQWWLLFAVMVAGKSAEQTSDKLNDLLADCNGGAPFDKIQVFVGQRSLRRKLETHKVGQYNRIETAFRHIVDHIDLDPRNWNLNTLELIPGVGPKTARWFRLLIDPDERVAALDTHILKFLRDCGYMDVPKSTPPSGVKYWKLEQAFLDACDELNMKPRDLDFTVWATYRAGGRIILPSAKARIELTVRQLP